MGRSIQIRVDESLAQILDRIKKSVADDFKKKYGLEEVTINGTIVSQIAAAKLKGNKVLSFKINKRGLNKGVLELF